MSGAVLNHEQLGHLRHWDNLSRQLPNDWSLMQGKGVSQDDFGGYRFQLAYMIYGLAVTHRHRLPAAPGLFRPTMQRLIDKLLMPEVWLYWRDVSRGGSVFNAHLADQLGEEWDPVVRDNIMYSAYVQSCATLHDVLFGSDRYAAPESLSFRHWSFFWGGGEKRFAYDRDSLTEHLYWLMVRTGYLGVACEPNCVFQICNQPAILGFRLHDQITGGSRAAEVVAGYEQAWADFGRLDDNGHYNMMITEDSRDVRPNERPSPWVDAWCGALMNTWNRDFVRDNYERQVADFLEPGPDGTLSVPSATARYVMGHEIVSDTCDFGWVAAWASEMGDRRTLDGLMAHADRFMNPTWRDGGLHYPRNDDHSDADGNRTEIEPMSGNVLLGYARLNVEDGLRAIYQDSWPAGHHDAPRLSAVDRDVEVSRAEVVDGVLHARLRRDRDVPGDGSGTVTLADLPHGSRLRLGGVEVDGRVDGPTEGAQRVVEVPDGPAVDLVVTP
ncbi:MAG: hypothetical protein J0I34_00105 [Pseudonocardia sp.]|uniref:linalool dehydratase/isomerase domain-containing protein n=1 Tax=unclassified Pseudonocardia TaxID=2619320 RepID=UPI00086B5EC9|nr:MULTISPECIES: hypothetical protein [unclassified Pseudonocardia]MBN9107158.1 hypothetical protein [Pseudonocardia sp.]ODU26359.1 MAG: hypothetical protein ABS80_07320 [Pseudonocardia sp. SCN 72-51]ODV02695.1 MAG: hypothetical protein ABT15_24745 [Pseudonocardia sp. SCN 73-27]